MAVYPLLAIAIRSRALSGLLVGFFIGWALSGFDLALSAFDWGLPVPELAGALIGLISGLLIEAKASRIHSMTDQLKPIKWPLVVFCTLLALAIIISLSLQELAHVYPHD